MFNFFGGNKDGLVTFSGMVQALNIIIKGSISEKAVFVFEVLNFFENRELGVYEFNSIMDMSFFIPLKQLKQV